MENNYEFYDVVYYCGLFTLHYNSELFRMKIVILKASSIISFYFELLWWNPEVFVTFFDFSFIYMGLILFGLT